MPNQLSPNPDRTVVDVRPGGPGNPWQVFQIDTTVEAPSGGGQSVESRWGRGAGGTLAPRGTIITSNPERVTFTMMTRLVSDRFLREMETLRCFFDVRTRYACDNLFDKNNYTETIQLEEGFVTSKTYNGAIALGTEATDPDLMNQYDVSAMFEGRKVKLRHDDISAAVSDVDIVDAAYVGSDSCNDCRTLTHTEWIAVTEQDATPGYASNPAPVFLWTTDGGATWGSIYVDVFPSVDASAVALAGGIVLVASPTAGVAYANYQDIKDGVTNPNVWSLATGFTAPNGVNDLVVVGGQVVLAVGDGGRLWRSTDGGLSFSPIATGTGDDLFSIDSASETLAWTGGENGTLLRISGSITDINAAPVVSIIQVEDAGGSILTDDINVVAVPPLRGSQPHLGTSGGEVWRTTRGEANRPVFENRAFIQSGSGSIDDLAFAGYKGDVLFAIQTDSSGDSRVLRDLSGGALGNDVEIVGSFAFPQNNGYAAIAPRNPNEAITVGAVAGSFGFIGKVQG